MMTAASSSTPPPPNVIYWDIRAGETTRRFALFDTPVSKAVCQEIFSGKCYPQIKFEQPVRTIVDVGANIGAATVHFSLVYPQARVFAFEPAPKSHSLLAANMAGLARVKTFAFGLLDRDRTAELYCGIDDAAQNSICQSYEQAQQSELVQLREAAAVLHELGIDAIDILKIDTEGCEVPILRSLLAWIPTNSAIFLEFHSEADRLEIDRLLSPTHYLWRGEIKHFCRGELCYLAKSCLHPDEERLRSARPPKWAD